MGHMQVFKDGGGDTQNHGATHASVCVYDTSWEAFISDGKKERKKEVFINQTQNTPIKWGSLHVFFYPQQVKTPLLAPL